MSLFLDGELLKTAPEYLDGYNGKDFALKILSKAYEKIKQNGYPVTFKCDKLRKGYRNGKPAIWIPFNGVIDNPDGGQRTLYYALSATGEENNRKYIPRGENMEKTWQLYAKDLDKILFMLVACPYVKNGQIYVENLEEQAKKVAERRSEDSVLSYHLYSERSPLFNNESQLIRLAYVWGVPNPADLGVNGLKNAIYDKVMAAERIGDKDFNCKKFDEIITTDFTPYYDMLMLVQRKIDEKVVKFNESSLRWMIMDGNGKEVRVICPVEPTKLSTRREILAKFLERHPETAEILSAKKEPETEKEPIAVEKGMDFEKLTWQEIRQLAKENNILVHGRNREQLIHELELKRKSVEAVA